MFYPTLAQTERSATLLSMIYLSMGEPPLSLGGHHCRETVFLVTLIRRMGPSGMLGAPGGHMRNHLEHSMFTQIVYALFGLALINLLIEFQQYLLTNLSSGDDGVPQLSRRSWSNLILSKYSEQVWSAFF